MITSLVADEDVVGIDTLRGARYVQSTAIAVPS